MSGSPKPWPGLASASPGRLRSDSRGLDANSSPSVYRVGRWGPGLGVPAAPGPVLPRTPPVDVPAQLPPIVAKIPHVAVPLMPVLAKVPDIVVALGDIVLHRLPVLPQLAAGVPDGLGIARLDGVA